jgi:hypothetical protein
MSDEQFEPVTAAPSAGSVNVTWESLTDEQRDALTPAQREKLQSGEPLPVDPRGAGAVGDPPAHELYLDGDEAHPDADGPDAGDADGERETTEPETSGGAGADGKPAVESETPIADGMNAEQDQG